MENVRGPSLSLRPERGCSNTFAKAHARICAAGAEVPCGCLHPGSCALRRDVLCASPTVSCSGCFGRKSKSDWTPLTKGARSPRLPAALFVCFNTSATRSALSEHNLMTTSNPILGDAARLRIANVPLTSSSFGDRHPLQHPHQNLIRAATLRHSSSVTRLFRRLDPVQESACQWCRAGAANFACVSHTHHLFKRRLLARFRRSIISSRVAD
jgi:hypothetical protein